MLTETKRASKVDEEEVETYEGLVDTVLACVLFLGTAGLALSRKMSA